jgi:NitT/TauT family transport system ATP-binding protein
MTREELGFEPMRIWNADKKTVIFVTHNITEAILLADRVMAIRRALGGLRKLSTSRCPGCALSTWSSRTRSSPIPTRSGP